jgi:hypothetical protein
VPRHAPVEPCYPSPCLYDISYSLDQALHKHGVNCPIVQIYIIYYKFSGSIALYVSISRTSLCIANSSLRAFKMPSSKSSISYLLPFLLSLTQSAASLTLSKSPPSDAIPVSPYLNSFSIEFENFPVFAGKTSSSSPRYWT